MVNVSFLGDISLNDNYVTLYKEGINPFSNLNPYLKKTDLIIGNLECFSKGDFGENKLKNPRLTTTIETLNYLKLIKLNVACLANNHVYDHLEDGFKKTTDFLQNNEISFLGASYEKGKESEPKIIEKDDLKIGLFNYVTEDTHPNLPSNASVFLNIFNLDKALIDIKSIKNRVNHLVILFHWGGSVEGGNYPDWYQITISRKLIDAGADLIIGHHSHTLQPYEEYKGKYIFYSLGNFCISNFSIGNKDYNYYNYNYISAIPTFTFDNKIKLKKILFIQNFETYYKVTDTSFKFILKKTFFKLFIRFKPFFYLYKFDYKYFKTIRSLLLCKKFSSNKKLDIIKTKIRSK
ncbi:MAG: CapA family protein [Bacteroidetes bacterium]|nr:CapA family protein [Bacteroidota bacterium]